jgi:uncharacterized membrane protein
LTKFWSVIKSHWRDVATTGLWLVVAVLASIALSLSHSPLVPLPGIVTIFLIPGAAVMSNLRTRPAHTSGRMVLAVCLSMMVIMVEGGVASVLGPLLGLAHPLDVLPQTVIWFALTLVVLTRGTFSHQDPVTWIFEDVHTPQLTVLLASGVLVVLSILGVAQLNHTDNIHFAVFATVLDCLVLLAGIVGGWKRTSRWPLSTLLYASSLALLLSTSLRGGHLFGWDVQQEFGVALHTFHTGVWNVPANHDAYASMLSLTVLPTILHSLVKLHLVAFFELVIPAILALLPVAVFATVRSVPRWVTGGRGVPRPGLALAVVVGLVISSVAFSTELVIITRQAMALTMLTALVMVLFDRTMQKVPARIIVLLLVITISFTHYTTSYLLAAILVFSWLVGLLWSRGWLGTPREKVEKHRYDVHSRKIIDGLIVGVAVVSAFGWNLVVTRNGALDAPTSAITSKGVGIGSSTLTAFLKPRQFERLLATEIKKYVNYLVPVPGSGSVHLAPAATSKQSIVVPSLTGFWKELTYLAVESIWVILGIALLYGLFRLGRRRSYEYSTDLVGLAVTGLSMGVFLRFSGTLSSFYDPERAAIFTAILLAAPATLFLDDLVARLTSARLFGHRVIHASLIAGFAFVGTLIFGATGLGSLLFGGQLAPGSLSANDLNVQDFAISTPEFATAVWLRNNVHSPNIVQSDLYGHLVLLSQPGSYDLIDEIVPPYVSRGSYVYLSTVNLKDKLSQANFDNQTYYTIYRSNIQFFNQNFYVVFSTGATRVYH